MINVYYIEYQDSVKFFRNECAIDIPKGKKLAGFLKACYKKYGKKIKFKELI